MLKEIADCRSPIMETWSDPNKIKFIMESATECGKLIKENKPLLKEYIEESLNSFDINPEVGINRLAAVSLYSSYGYYSGACLLEGTDLARFVELIESTELSDSTKLQFPIVSSLVTEEQRKVYDKLLEEEVLKEKASADLLHAVSSELRKLKMIGKHLGLKTVNAVVLYLETKLKPIIKGKYWFFNDRKLKDILRMASGFFMGLQNIASVELPSLLEIDPFTTLEKFPNRPAVEVFAPEEHAEASSMLASRIKPSFFAELGSGWFGSIPSLSKVLKLIQKESSALNSLPGSDISSKVANDLLNLSLNQMIGLSQGTIEAIQMLSSVGKQQILATDRESKEDVLDASSEDKESILKSKINQVLTTIKDRISLEMTNKKLAQRLLGLTDAELAHHVYSILSNPARATAFFKVYNTGLHGMSENDIINAYLQFLATHKASYVADTVANVKNEFARNNPTQATPAKANPAQPPAAKPVEPQLDQDYSESPLG